MNIRQIFGLLAAIACAGSVQAQRVGWEADFKTRFDNREFTGSSCNESQTIFLADLSTAVSYNWLDRNTLRFGVQMQKDFGDKINFCGSVCVQSTLAFGTVDDVVREVERRKRLFPEAGLFLGPSHAIQVGTPLENILAMYRTADSLTEEVDDSILAISEGRDATTINMSKLF